MIRGIFVIRKTDIKFSLGQLSGLILGIFALIRGENLESLLTDDK
jgi:hypothetical protein